MDDITRSEALNYARFQYLLIRDRALAGADEGVTGYVRGLAESWDAHLKHLASLGSGIKVRPETVEALVRLARRAGSESMPLDALVDWVDAFPEAVAEMLPPSESTFTLVREVRRPVAQRNALVSPKSADSLAA